MDVHSYMSDWAINYVKNKDSFAKKILQIQKIEGYDSYIKYKDREQYIIVSPSLSDIQGITSRLNNNAYFLVVTLNSPDNLRAIVDNWKRFIEFKYLSIVFANPFSQKDKRWVIAPYTHHMICDEKSLEIGLKSMFDMVDPIDQKALSERIKG